MLNQQRSGNLARLKYLMAVPICAVLFCAPTLAFSKIYSWVDVMPVKDLPKPQEQKPDTLPRNLLMFRFLADLEANVKYPAEAVKNKFEGHAIATFTVANYKVKNIKIIIRGKGYGIPEEITRALQNLPQPVNILPGKYALPFYFSLGRLVHGHRVDKDDKIQEFKGVATGFKYLNEIVIEHP